MNNDILIYIDSCINKLNHQLKRDDISDSAREGLLLRKEVFEDVKERFEWAVRPSEDKQSQRILNLAKLRERGEDISDQLKEINLYSKIIETIPYIKAVSYKINNESKHLTEDLLVFCETQLKTIDFSSNKRKITFPTKQEVEEAFKSYTERIKPDKIPSLKVYEQPEVKQKIGELYDMFLAVAEIN